MVAHIAVLPLRWVIRPPSSTIWCVLYLPKVFPAGSPGIAGAFLAGLAGAGVVDADLAESVWVCAAAVNPQTARFAARVRVLNRNRLTAGHPPRLWFDLV